MDCLKSSNFSTPKKFAQKIYRLCEPSKVLETQIITYKRCVSKTAWNGFVSKSSTFSHADFKHEAMTLGVGSGDEKDWWSMSKQFAYVSK